MSRRYPRPEPYHLHPGQPHDWGRLFTYPTRRLCFVCGVVEDKTTGETIRRSPAAATTTNRREP